MAWAGVGLAVALSALNAINADARVAVGVASIAFPSAALLGAFALKARRDRISGALLLISVATPTYFAWVLNIPAFVVGLALLLAPKATIRAEQIPSEPCDIK